VSILFAARKLPYKCCFLFDLFFLTLSRYNEAMLKVDEIEYQYVTNAAGEKMAVVIPINAFQQLLEDLEDLAAVAERREEETVSHADLIAELKADGLLHD